MEDQKITSDPHCHCRIDVTLTTSLQCIITTAGSPFPSRDPLMLAALPSSKTQYWAEQEPLLCHYIVGGNWPGIEIRQHSSTRWYGFLTLLLMLPFREAHVQECTNPTGVQGRGRCGNCVWCGQLSAPNHHLETQRPWRYPEERW